MKNKVKIKLAVPGSVYRKLEVISTQEGKTVPEVLREATRLALFVRAIAQDPHARLLIERGGEAREIIVS